MIKRLFKITLVVFFFVFVFVLCWSSNTLLPLAQAQDANWCNPDPAGTNYGSPCEPNGSTDCGGDGKETICQNYTWHATGNCCEQPGGGDGGDECLHDITGYVTATGSLRSGYDQCNNSGHWCIKLDGLPVDKNNSGCYVAELYTDPIQSCGEQETNLRKRVEATNGTEICFDSAGWEGDCRAQLDIRRNVSGARAGNIKTFLIDCNPPSNTPTPTPPQVPRSVSGRVYCQDGSGPIYPIPNIQMTIIRNSLNNANPTTDSNGNFSADLTGADPRFAVRLPQSFPSGTLTTGQPYSEMIGPALNDKSQYDGAKYCDPGGYEVCEVSVTNNHTNFDFRYTNCSPPPAPQCNQIEMRNQQGGSDIPTLSPGVRVQFICSGNSPNIHYQFRVGKQQAGAPNPSNIQVGNSYSFEIPAGENSYGDYVAQCRVCSGNDGSNCSEWEAWPNY